VGTDLQSFSLLVSRPLIPSKIVTVLIRQILSFYMAFLLQNTEHKHRTEVWVMRVTEELPEWEDSRAIGRKRKWFTIPEALLQLGQHKPVQRSYLHSLHNTNPRHNPTSQLSNHSHSTMASIELMNNSSNNTHLSEHS